MIVVKGTYDIVDERRLSIAEEPEPITVTEEYAGDEASSSLLRAGDLAGFKPRADVAVIGTSYAPRLLAAPSWLTDVRIGDVRKTLRVYGRRTWHRSMGMFWQLGEPEPTVEVPIRYELAYGGTFDDGHETHVFERNPVGVGYTHGRIPRDHREIPAPQIEDARDPITELGKEHAPAGLGFIARSWEPRLARAGTFDERWEREKWPLPPDDWDDAFNNAAHPDLIYPGYLNGGEPFSALSMTPSGSLGFTVPSEKIDVRYRYRSGDIVTYGTNLDTFVVDLRTNKVLLTYRARLPEGPSVRVLEILMRSD